MLRLCVFLSGDRHWKDKRLLCGRFELSESCYRGQDSPSGHEDDPPDWHETKHSIIPPHMYLSWLCSQGQSQIGSPVTRTPTSAQCLKVFVQLVTEAENIILRSHWKLDVKKLLCHNDMTCYISKELNTGSMLYVYKVKMINVKMV